MKGPMVRRNPRLQTRRDEAGIVDTDVRRENQEPAGSVTEEQTGEGWTVWHVNTEGSLAMSERTGEPEAEPLTDRERSHISVHSNGPVFFPDVADHGASRQFPEVSSSALEQ